MIAPLAIACAAGIVMLMAALISATALAMGSEDDPEGEAPRV